MMVMMTTMTMTMMMRRCMLNGVTHISVPMNTCPQHAHLNKQKPAHTHTHPAQNPGTATHTRGIRLKQGRARPRRPSRSLGEAAPAPPGCTQARRREGCQRAAPAAGRRRHPQAREAAHAVPGTRKPALPQGKDSRLLALLASAAGQTVSEKGR